MHKLVKLSKNGNVFVHAVIIGAKDLRQRLRDNTAIVMAVIAPLSLAFILNATLGSAVEQTQFEFAVLNQDQGDLGAAFDSLVDELTSDDVAAIVPVANRQELDDLVADGTVNAGFVVPAGFSEATQSGQPAELLVIGDRNSPISVSVAEAITNGFASNVDYVGVAVASSATALAGQADIEQLAAAALEIPTPITLTTTSEEGRGFDTTTYYSISLSVFFLFFTVQFGVLSLLEEEEAGTLPRLRTAPIAPAAIIVGKLVSSLVLGLASMTVMIVSTSYLMGAEWGSPGGIAVFLLLGALAGVSTAAIVASVAKTAEQASAYGSMVAVVLGLVGGSFFPLSQSPGLIGSLSYISPHRWILEGFRGVSYGDPVTSLGTPIIALIMFILITGAVGLWAATRGVASR